MNLEPLLPAFYNPLWADGLDGQEDEIEDVEKGKLDPPTDDEGPGSIFDKNDAGRSLESEDEDEDLAVASQEDEDELRRERTDIPY